MALLAVGWSLGCHAGVAAARHQVIGQASGTAVGDGVRYVLFPTGSAVTIWDSRSLKRRVIPMPSACAILDGHRARFLLSCDDGATPELIIVNAGSGSAMPVRFEPSGADSYDRIGRHWLAGQDCGSGHCELVYRSLATGALGTPEGPSPQPDPSVVPPGEHFNPNPKFRAPDLDDPRLRVRQPRERWFYRVRNDGTRLWYQRAGRQQVVSRCTSGCSRVELGSGLLTYLNTTAPARRLRATQATVWNTHTHRARRYRATSFMKNGRFLGIHPTRAHIVLEVAPASDATSSTVFFVSR